jgi:cytochrome c553
MRPLALELLHRFGKPAGVQAAFFAIISILVSTNGQAETAMGDTVSKQELTAKITYCENCHGASAQGFHGYYPIPRLAGQQPEYIKNQMEAFIERRRTNNIMFSVAHVLRPALAHSLTEQQIKTVAAYLNQLE